MIGYFNSQDEAYEYAFDNNLLDVVVEKIEEGWYALRWA